MYLCNYNKKTIYYNLITLQKMTSSFIPSCRTIKANRHLLIDHRHCFPNGAAAFQVFTQNGKPGFSLLSWCLLSAVIIIINY